MDIGVSEIDADVFMRASGITPKLLAAKEDGIPKELLELLPDPENEIAGMGLVGGIGYGKSSFLSVLVRRKMQFMIDQAKEKIDIWNETLDEYNANLPEPDPFDFDEDSGPRQERYYSEIGYRMKQQFVWAYWPAYFDYFQELAINRNHRGKDIYGLEYLMEIPCLILDDLGRERIKITNDSVPYGLAKLDLLIDYRNQHSLPILWTSNLEEEALIKTYGFPTYSRLVQDNPAIVLPEMSNLRNRPIPV